ncbi:MAG: hypothetical protein QM666_09555 [Acinetobacter sp.]
MNYPELIFLGDSHTCYFDYGIKKGLYKPYKASTCIVDEATALGLKDSDSFTGESKRFREFLIDKPKNSYIFLHLGEVDCGVLIWFEAQKNQISVQDQAKQSIDAYFEFIEGLRSEGYNNIIITSATLPTINDDDHASEIVLLRKQKVSATFQERTDLTVYFNKLLRTRAKKVGIQFIDVTTSFIDRATNFTHLKFRNKKLGDHHMDNNYASVVWSKHINDFIQSNHRLSTSKSIRIAKVDTFVKALDVLAKDLSNDLIVNVKNGDKLIFEVIDHYGKTIVIKNAKLNGRKLKDTFKFIHAPHFNEYT